MYKKIYYLFGGLSFVIGQPLLYVNIKIGLSIILGMCVPILMSYINIIIIDYITATSGNQMTAMFNAIQFISKTIFMCLMTYLGVVIAELNVAIYVGLLSTTWFTFHVIEAFYTNTLIKK